MSQYVHFSIFLISVPNLIVISLMIVVFALGVALALPHPTDTTEVQDGQE
jgi:hypothetical protein